ncbi:MAG: peptidoglycan editing factor PgeF [Candidatus Omnitrophica bacterium]|nr:peptidoglycan editing factor PgeF [Candidatus Omnitrophota bacterium]
MKTSEILKENNLFPILPHTGVVVAGFTGRRHGNMSLSYGDTRFALENRRAFLDELGIKHDDLICVKQVHGSEVAVVTEEHRGKGAFDHHSAINGTDAFITNKKNLALAIFSADCLSVFLHDRKNNAIGLVHAGWKGSKEGICAKAVSEMKNNFGTSAQDLYAGFGPAIRKCCYEVGEEFHRHFPGKVAKRLDKFYLDLAQVNKEQLLNCDLKEENIFDSKICTSCRIKDFYSYRQEGSSCGRIMSVAMLK